MTKKIHHDEPEFVDVLDGLMNKVSDDAQSAGLCPECFVSHVYMWALTNLYVNYAHTNKDDVLRILMDMNDKSKSAARRILTSGLLDTRLH